MTSERDPQPGAYRPFVAARAPGGRPPTEPAYRVLVHRQYLDAWNSLADRVGITSARQFWEHVSCTPGTPPAVGTSTVLRGKHHGPKWEGYSRTIHYEISGAGRIDYQYCNATTEGDRGDPHPVVKILTIDLGSH
ncbi:hypothetical protein [Nocardia sienata]|uniref:hypothetical protein n=1 Tax=Nocardia sienata TaxID=248552 RepID=UPI0012ED369A|nr:hypothetical protein [Nocardia sienata]